MTATFEQAPQSRETGRGLWRDGGLWLGAGTAALALHVAAFATLLTAPPPGPPPGVEEAFAVEMAPELFAPPADLVSDTPPEVAPPASDAPELTADQPPEPLTPETTPPPEVAPPPDLPDLAQAAPPPPEPAVPAPVAPEPLPPQEPPPEEVAALPEIPQAEALLPRLAPVPAAPRPPVPQTDRKSVV